MASGAKRLLVCLLAMCILRNVHFETERCVLHPKVSLYVLDAGYLPDIQFANIPPFILWLLFLSQ